MKQGKCRKTVKHVLSPPVICIFGTAAVTNISGNQVSVTEPGLITTRRSQSKNNDAIQATIAHPNVSYRHFVGSVQNKQPLLKLEFDRCRSKPPVGAVNLSRFGDPTTI